MGHARRHPGTRAKVVWTGAIALLAAGVFALAELHGRAARLPFHPPAGLGARPVAVVGDAADAVRIWRAAGVRGRRLVVLTGQWSKPPTPEEPAAAGRSGDLVPLDAASALYTAARLGVVRSIDVVMPPPAFTRRLGEVTGQKALEGGNGAFRLAFNGLERRFSIPNAFVAPEEPALVLVEPTWFAEAAPADPLAWLSASGVTFDLALLALDDPAASEEERRAALSFAQAAWAPLLESAE